LLAIDGTAIRHQPLSGVFSKHCTVCECRSCARDIPYIKKAALAAFLSLDIYYCLAGGAAGGC
jgi:hypothetical protein